MCFLLLLHQLTANSAAGDEKCVFSRFRRPESEIGGGGFGPLWRLRGDLFLPSSQLPVATDSPWLLDLQMLHSNFCLYLHVCLSLCVLSS